MAKSFACGDVADVDFYYGCLQASYAVLQSYAGVCVGACIQDDAVEIESHFLHFIDEFALYVALEIGELNVWIPRGELSEIVFKRFLSVDFRLTHAQKV